jgi:trimeric autotransporter adhesin
MRRHLPRFLALSLICLAGACGGGGGSTPPPPPPPVRAGALQFAAATLEVDENAGTASIAVTRTGGSDGAVSVTVVSRDGLAIAGQDYGGLNATTVSFAAGDSAAKTVAVSIIDNDQLEAVETFALELLNPTAGASLAANRETTITINDNDVPTLEVAVSEIKQLTFTWAQIVAASYRLLRDPDGESGFTRVGEELGGDAVSTQLEIAIHRDFNALYQLEACVGEVCAVSEAISARDKVLDAIGYFKASNTDQPSDNPADNPVGDEFGAAVAISGDGKTLAVGAPQEESSATCTPTCIGGDEPNNDVPFAGAVYVFARAGTTWSQQAYVKASNTDADDKFGSSVALSADGNTLAVSAPREASNARGVNVDEENDDAPAAGAIYVYVRNGTEWSKQAYLKASNADFGDFFGASLALSGDGNTLAGGAPGEDGDDNLVVESGAAYVFVRDDKGIWSEQAYVKAPNAQGANDEDGGDGFGTVVALAANGNTLAVSATGEDGSATGVGSIDNDNNDAQDAGAVYIFTRSPEGIWSDDVTYVKATDTGAFDEFGQSLALSGDGKTLAVGTPFYRSLEDEGLEDNPDEAVGAVYVYSRGADNQWVPQAFVQASNPERVDLFGSSVALSFDGNTLAASAVLESSDATGVDGDQTNNRALDAGAVYVLKRAGTEWSQQAYVKASNTQEGDFFGASVALSADAGTADAGTLVVGTPGEDGKATGINGDQTNNESEDSGAVFVY